MCGLKSSVSEMIQCWALVNEVMNFQIHRGGEFLIEVTVRISGRTVLALVGSERKFEHFQRLESYLLIYHT